MQDALTILRRLRRPRLLIRAARAGLAEYRRDVHLRRTLGGEAPQRCGPALIRLIEIETDLNDARLRKCASYSVARHVEVLVAMMGEAQLLRPAQ
ncbi:MAG: DUF6477 family protein [Marinovum algicola]|jgi:hypothetical protein|uniref:Uncharacterized protein n=1 Tax=Marinovum algicola TaxID=42444 RepID=A0A975ZLW8_9RHOB|nr:MULTISPECIES: DUF6477 family protein [Marinovum]AKO96611.1 hypothetical protein MALG_01426 [Marinovum algicola DG 898]MDD9739083.1 DUF6477 family protein [Marinovum sp. SP66]MDD9744136.1 DUF6477 family protein [Marinovum sp. PR37]SEI79941.1 hypothetical protein SAMN04487940_10276 [Marinovum algicola]SLN17468.1 hypothetical protein MAA5396_00438 [Marinovum algicola]